jgi:hypothetical protein
MYEKLVKIIVDGEWNGGTLAWKATKETMVGENVKEKIGIFVVVKNNSWEILLMFQSSSFMEFPKLDKLWRPW